MNATTSDGMGRIAGRMGWLAEQSWLREKARQQGTEIRSFEEWRQLGRWVRKGQRQRAISVQCGVRRVGIDPITGEDRYVPQYKTVYGFTRDQVN